MDSMSLTGQGAIEVIRYGSSLPPLAVSTFIHVQLLINLSVLNQQSTVIAVIAV